MTHQEAKQILSACLALDARQGLPEELFLAISTILPIPNVDLLVLNERREILLAWRDDPYFEPGWHLPGGCLRYKETMLERVQKTALAELGQAVTIDPQPLAVRDAIRGREDESLRFRAHHVAVLYECHLTKPLADTPLHDGIREAGDLKWFTKLPPNLLRIHEIYRDVFERYQLYEEQDS